MKKHWLCAPKKIEPCLCHKSEAVAITLVQNMKYLGYGEKSGMLSELFPVSEILFFLILMQYESDVLGDVCETGHVDSSDKNSLGLRCEI